MSRQINRQRDPRVSKSAVPPTPGFVDRLGDALEGKGRTLLYGLAALALVGVIAGVVRTVRARGEDRSRAALAAAIKIQEAQVSATPQASPAAPNPEQTFPTEQARAEAANKKFQEVVADHGEPFSGIARYFIATNNLTLDRAKGIGELETLAKSGDDEIAAPARFALALAYESDAKHDQAANLYTQLLKEDDDEAFPDDTLNVRLAAVYEKQGKRNEAVDLLFRTIETARKARGKDDKPVRSSLAVQEAAERLQTLDPARYAQLPPEPIIDPIT